VFAAVDISRSVVSWLWEKIVVGMEWCASDGDGSLFGTDVVG
jgi:hypothetical protein